MICDVRVRGKAIVIQCGRRRFPMWLSNRGRRILPRLVSNQKKRQYFGLVEWDKSLSLTFLFLKNKLECLREWQIVMIRIWQSLVADYVR